MDEAARFNSQTGGGTTSTETIDAAPAEAAATALERYKVSLRRYSPVQKGLAGLPWPGEWLCGRCGETSPGRLLREADADAIVARARLPRAAGPGASRSWTSSSRPRR